MILFVLCILSCYSGPHEPGDLAVNALSAQRLVAALDFSIHAAINEADVHERALMADLQLGVKVGHLVVQRYPEREKMIQASKKISRGLARQALEEFISQGRSYNFILNEVLHSVNHDPQWTFDYKYLMGMVFVMKSPVRNIRTINLLKSFKKEDLLNEVDSVQSTNSNIFDRRHDATTRNILSLTKQFKMGEYLVHAPSQVIWIRSPTAPESMGLMTRKSTYYLVVSGPTEDEFYDRFIMIHELLHAYVSAYLRGDSDVLVLINKTAYIRNYLSSHPDLDNIYPNWRLLFEEILVRAMTEMCFSVSSGFKRIFFEENLLRFLIEVEDSEKEKSINKFLISLPRLLRN